MVAVRAKYGCYFFVSETGQTKGPTSPLQSFRGPKGRTFEFSRQLPTSPLHWQLPTTQRGFSSHVQVTPLLFHCRSIFLPLPPSSFHCRSIFLPLPPSASSIKQLPSASTIAGQEGNGGGIVEQLPSVCQENGGGIVEQLPSVCQASPW